MTESHAYVHADLIFGLPGENLESFSQSFGRLYAIGPHEIQVGILKRLKGSPIIRHTIEHDMVFNPNPPFSILSNDLISFQDLQFMARFARYWDMLGNSGRFRESMALLLGSENGRPFQVFAQLSGELFKRTEQTHRIALIRLFDLIHDIANETMSVDKAAFQQALENDFNRSGLKSLPKFMTGDGHIKSKANQSKQKFASRQARHF